MVWLAGTEDECAFAAQTLGKLRDRIRIDRGPAPPEDASCAVVFGGSALVPPARALEIGRMLRIRGLPGAVVMSRSADADIESLLALSDTFRYLIAAAVSARDLSRLVERLADSAGSERAVSIYAAANGLSAQETRLLNAAVAGVNNDVAAEALGCCRSTVTTYWNRIFSKTAQRGQRDVVAAVLRHYSASR